MSIAPPMVFLFYYKTKALQIVKKLLQIVPNWLLNVDMNNISIFSLCGVGDVYVCIVR